MEPRKTTFIIIFLAIGLSTAFKMDLTRTINFSSDEGRVAVYDAAMPAWLTSMLADFFEEGTRWSYEYPDKLAGVSPRENNNMPWVSPISPLFLMKSKPWIVFNKLAEDFTGRDDMVAFQVTATMLTRGDTPAVVPGKTHKFFMLSVNTVQLIIEMSTVNCRGRGTEITHRGSGGQLTLCHHDHAEGESEMVF